MSVFGQPELVRAQREAIRPLLVPTDPQDAMTAYYALLHDPRRTQLMLHRAVAGQVDGFIAVCQTGRDLFVPLVVIRADRRDVGELVRRALQPGRPYTLVTTPALYPAVAEHMLVERQQINRIYVLEAAPPDPGINVMVQPGTSEFRYEIRTQDRIVAAAGVNWRSERLADMYVYTEPDSQGRGWGKAVGSACVKALVAARLLPLYTVAEENTASLELARALGFRDSDAREYECLVRLRGED